MVGAAWVRRKGRVDGGDGRAEVGRRVSERTPSVVKGEAECAVREAVRAVEVGVMVREKVRGAVGEEEEEGCEGEVRGAVEVAGGSGKWKVNEKGGWCGGRAVGGGRRRVCAAATCRARGFGGAGGHGDRVGICRRW